MSAPYPDMPHAQLDPSGLLARCCWDSHLAGRTAGYVEGHAAGRQEVLDGIEQDVAQVIRGAIRGVDVQAARRRPYTVPGWAR